MSQFALKAPLKYLVAISVGMALGGALGWAFVGFSRQIDEKVQESNQGKPAAVAPVPVSEHETPPLEHPGWHYAEAVRRGDWDEVMRRTPWIRERLDYVAMNEGGDEARQKAIKELRDRLGNRLPSAVENHLDTEGVEDQFVFSAASELRALAVDAGLEGLEAPTASRVWIEVTYPSRELALRDGNQIPLRRIVVGVNTSADGDILKANTVGNLEVQPGSVAYFKAGSVDIE